MPSLGNHTITGLNSLPSLSHHPRASLRLVYSRVVRVSLRNRLSRIRRVRNRNYAAGWNVNALHATSGASVHTTSNDTGAGDGNTTTDGTTATAATCRATAAAATA